ncbi:hypothetical protein BJF78_27430 [Pseudonocardia sp. CNS-139]|nr:hypothetical protein BJF78_27430 [Pseudonocardia sp. CNS-139]
MSSAIAPTAAVPPKSMPTNVMPDASCSQCGISAHEPGRSTCSSVRVAIMCQRHAMPANGTT